MQVIRDNPGRPLLQSSVVMIGNFDGLHLGHQSLIEYSKDLSGGQHPLAVVTFEPTPRAWFGPENAPARLMSVRQKLDFLAAENIDLVWLMRFNQVLADVSPDQFVSSVLVDTLKVEQVVVGEDFRYGRARQGDTASLRKSGEELDFGVNIVSMLEVDGQVVSSTAIRDYLEQGELGRAEQMLGRPYRMAGRVIRGRQLGRELGYPTANMRLAAKPSPLGGVFAIRARWDGSDWRDGVAEKTGLTSAST